MSHLIVAALHMSAESSCFNSVFHVFGAQVCIVGFGY